MKTLKICGDIIQNGVAWAYEWYEFDYTSPKNVQTVIDSLEDDNEELLVLINSGGGDVMAGQQIYSMLKAVKNHVTVEIQSMAASAASMIAMAGDTVRISPVAMIMIHNASTEASGDYRDMMHTAGVLQSVNDALANAYIAKTGKTKAEILSMMDAETWMSPNECLKNGFVDEIITDSENQNHFSFLNSFCILKVTQEMIRSAEKQRAEAEEILADLDDFGV